VFGAAVVILALLHSGVAAEAGLAVKPTSSVEITPMMALMAPTLKRFLFTVLQFVGS
jgi:hypothetical protein